MAGNPQILIVKLSSMGDVLHNLPIVWDLRRQLPDAQIDWVVEEAYVDLLKPLQTNAKFKGIDRIIPLGLRRWKKNPLSLMYWQELFAMKKLLQSQSYDYIIETQGLIKSAIVCQMAGQSKNAIIAGLANATDYSGYEPLARLFYNQLVQVPKQLHAVDRSRWVMCSALNWPVIDRINNPPQFYPDYFLSSLNQKTPFESPYVLCFHSSARDQKRWANSNWIILGKELAQRGLQLIFPWGNLAEKAISQSLVDQIPNAIVPQAFSIQDYFGIIANARLTIGVDTGLTHLSAVLSKPTIEIYCDSPLWKTEGYWSNQIRNVGDLQRPPNLETVLSAANRLLEIN